MIGNAIEYCEESQAIVDRFSALKPEDKTSGYWNDDSLEELKKEIKDHYLVEQQNTCSYCAQTIRVKHGATWDTEHVVARKTHPQFMFEPKNLCVACKDCNGIKGDKNVLQNPKRKTYPKSSGDFLITHPHFDEYGEHIYIVGNKVYVPVTEKGKFTIELCGLLRFAVKKIGWDPIVALEQQIMLLALKLPDIKNATERRIILQQIAILSQLSAGDYITRLVSAKKPRRSSKRKNPPTQAKKRSPKRR
jgi:5-methylcytosine-specific restriction endonuclease McrA